MSFLRNILVITSKNITFAKKCFSDRFFPRSETAPALHITLTRTLFIKQKELCHTQITRRKKPTA